MTDVIKSYVLLTKVIATSHFYFISFSGSHTVTYSSIVPDYDFVITFGFNLLR
jgi:hypothetical protein